MDLPLEILRQILPYAVLNRGIWRALRLRLVSSAYILVFSNSFNIVTSNSSPLELFDIEAKQAIFESGIIKEFQQEDRGFWRAYMGHVVFSKNENTCSALMQVRRIAERLCHEIGVSDDVIHTSTRGSIMRHDI